MTDKCEVWIFYGQNDTVAKPGESIKVQSEINGDNYILRIQRILDVIPDWEGYTAVKYRGVRRELDDTSDRPGE